MRRSLLILALLFASAVWAYSAPQSQSQNIELRSGWNLISLQTGSGLSPQEFASKLGPLGVDAAKLEAIWNFGDASIAGSAPWQWKVWRKDPLEPRDLTILQPGKGYWVNVSSPCTATISGVPWDGAISVRQGWNLLGFPGLSREDSEVQELASVFGSHFDRVTQVWAWDSSSAQRFTGYDITSIPQVKELTGVQPGLGYWVYALGDFTLVPRPTLVLPGDADASPLEPEVEFSAADFPLLPNPQDYIYTDAQGVQRGLMIRKVRAGSEDAPFDLNGNKIIDSAFTQDTLRFDIGVNRKVISITNRGTGLFNWSIENTIPWLFTAPVDERNHPGNTGRAKTAAGTVSSETDAITLYADTRGLLPGQQTGQILVHLGNVTRIVTVLLDVPVSAGDWKGYATTQRVNGRSIPIGAVDLGLNVFMLSDQPGESRFRAVLNRDTSLLFPRDVFMNGVFYAGNDFSLTTNFEMPAGDRNAPPFDTFQRPPDYDQLSGTAGARADYDANNDRKLDVANPFPFSVRRELTLLGTRRTPNRMEGSYVESITGLLPDQQAIFIEGTFFLDRQNYEPTKRSIFNQTTTGVPILIGGSSGQPFRETILEVSSAVSISGVVLALNVNFPDPTKLTISLIGPNGRTVIIHNGGATLPSSVALNDYNGLTGSGPWRLRVAWAPTAERGHFNSWGLNLLGLATYSVTGQIVGNTGGGNASLEGAHLVLSGSNLIEQTVTAANGTFTFTGLTENNYTLSISRPGFESRLVSFFLNDTSLYIGQAGAVPAVPAPNDPLVLVPVSVTTPELRAGPFIGQAPLHVSYSAFIPLASLSALGTLQSAVWNFGDGSTPVAADASTTDDVTTATANHIYQNAGVFTATLTLTGSSGSLVVPGSEILAQRILPDPNMPLTGSGQPAGQCLVAGFVGAFAAPLDNAATVEVTGTGTTDYTINVRQPNGSYGAMNLTGLQRRTVYQESKRDTAAFDQDRAPFLANPYAPNPPDFHPNEEDTDFGDPAKLTYVSGDGSITLPFLVRPYSALTASEQQDVELDLSALTYKAYAPPEVNGQPIPARFRIIPTLGGTVFNPVPSRVGDFILQTGRVDP